MKINYFFVLLSIIATTSLAQLKPSELDKSPMDVSYYPPNYPLIKLNGKAKEIPIARVIYSRPQKNNRIIFDGIIKYNEMWRLGANEATEIEFFKPVKINNKAISKGRYTLYCIPNLESWTIIINKDNFSWGNYSYNIKNDVLRIDIPLEKSENVIEAFTMYFNETKTGANLIFMWDNIKASLPILFQL